jgi:hypothetical protein
MAILTLTLALLVISILLLERLSGFTIRPAYVSAVSIRKKRHASPTR